MIRFPTPASHGGRRTAAWTGAAVLGMILLSVPVTVRSQARDTVSATPTLNRLTAATKDTVAARGDSAAASRPLILITVAKRGDIEIELLPDQAPKACERIRALVKSGFYNGLRFHRVESYLVQAGAGESKLPPVEGEMFSQRLSQEAGMVGMARLPDDYDSATTQFYILKERRPLLNSEYTLFGRVVRGMDVVNAIQKGDVIRSVTVVESPQ